MNPLLAIPDLTRLGPERDLWAEAAVRERFRAGELLADWFDANPAHSDEQAEQASEVALDLQAAAKSALDEVGIEALRLPTQTRVEVLKAIGLDEIRLRLAARPGGERNESELLLATLLGDEPIRPDLQDREQLSTLARVGAIAQAAGAALSFVPAELREQVERLDFLQMVGGPDLHRFVGREKELAKLHMAWRDPRSQVLALVEGAGGMGKSLLVSRFVADILEGEEALRPSAVFHLDFDRRDLQQARPATIIAELVRQARRWVAREDLPRLDALTGSARGHDGALESFGTLRSSEVYGESAWDLVELLRRPGRECRILIFADSAEQVLGFDDVAARSPMAAASALDRAGADSVLLVYGARWYPKARREQPTFGFDDASPWRGVEPDFHVRLTELRPAEAKAYLAAECARLGVAVSDRIIGQVLKAVGRSPLAVRLAAALLEKEGPEADPAKWAGALRDHPERLQAALYDRVLYRVRDPELRKIAFPGLLVRRLTAGVIATVLAEPCGLDLSVVTPAGLLEKARKEGQLFQHDSSDPDPAAVWHRPDVRALMLRDLDAAAARGELADKALAINQLAVKFYQSEPGEVARVEELYHRLRLDEDEQSLGTEWRSVADRLRGVQDQFPPKARAWLRRQLGAASLQSMAARPVGDVGTAAGFQAEEERLFELRGVVQRELQAGASPMETLVRYNADTLQGPLADLYAEALVSVGRVEDLTQAGRRLRNAPRRLPPRVLAGVFNAAAGALEGQGKLSEAETFWSAAVAQRLSDEEEATLVALGARIGLMRTRRKRLAGRVDRRRGDEARAALELIQRAGYALFSRRVLARETAAELSDLLTDPALGGSARESLTRLLSTTFESQEAFPAAAGVPQRLAKLGTVLVGAPVDSLRELTGLSMKLIYGAPEQLTPLIWALREEVDWTLERAVSQPLAEQSAFQV